MSSFPQVAHALQHVLSEAPADLARSSGCCQRRSKLTAACFVQTTVCGWLAHPTARPFVNSQRFDMNSEPFMQWSEENGLPAPPEPKAGRLLRVDGRPTLRLPGDGRPMGEFAAEIGRMLADQDIFARKGCAFALDAEGQKIEPAMPTWLRSWAEKFVVCYKTRSRDGQQISFTSTMTDDAARVVLQAPQFLERLRRVERFHPCRMPVIRNDGTLELLPVGHDLESATYTAPGVSYPLYMSAEDARFQVESATVKREAARLVSAGKR